MSRPAMMPEFWLPEMTVLLGPDFSGLSVAMLLSRRRRRLFAMEPRDLVSPGGTRWRRWWLDLRRSGWSRHRSLLVLEGLPGSIESFGRQSGTAAGERECQPCCIFLLRHFQGHALLQDRLLLGRPGRGELPPC